MSCQPRRSQPGKAGAMGLEQPIGSDQPWETVLSAAPVKPFTFFIVAVAGDGSEARIANTDGTVTVLIGTGLTAHGSTADGTGARARLTGGRIGELRRLDGAGELLESVSGLDIAAGGPSRLVSFSRPDGSMTSLAWARQLQVQFKADAAASAPRADACAPAAQIAIPAIPAIPATPANPAAAGLAPSALDLSVSNRIHTAPPASARRTRSAAVVFASAAAGIATVGLLGAWLSSRGVDVELDQLRTRYTRPTSIPYPADNVPTQARVDLGRRLFSETLLSANGEVSCASCHKAELAFSDGVAYGRGITGRPLKLHTQSLWNVAWGRVFFWDGRSTTLESQARDPMANPEEMGQPIEAGAAKLAADPSYKPAFAAAFPENPSISPDTIVKALASYERTLVSPPTRFDRTSTYGLTLLMASSKI